MGLQGMIKDLVEKSDYPIGQHLIGKIGDLTSSNHSAIAPFISAAENYPDQHKEAIEQLREKAVIIPVLDITGTGGAGEVLISR